MARGRRPAPAHPPPPPAAPPAERAALMAEVLFYHLTARPLEAVLPDLLEKTLERGWRAIVRAGSSERVEALNGLLWTYRDESFLPHGGPGDGFEAAQPIYLTAGEETPNGADVLFLVDGASEQVTAMSAYQRVVLMFDGHDPTAVEAARSVWRSVTAAEMKALYWAQEGGRWVKKAESAAPSA